MIDHDDQPKENRVLIVGLGKTGLSVARFLAGSHVQFAVTDSRQQPPGMTELQDELPDVAVFSGSFDEQMFASVDQLIVSPGVPLSEPAIRKAVEQGVSVVGDIELFARAVNAPVIAITGSNGKSTVTTLLGEMAAADGLNVAVGGNLGTPALDLLADDVELYILELSSFQLETLQSLRPVAATVLNISEDHMDRYPSLEAYAQVKEKLLGMSGLAVVNLDDPRVSHMKTPTPPVGFTLAKPSGDSVYGLLDEDGDCWLAHGTEPLCRCDELLIPGKHNLANALAALALGEAAGLSMPAMLGALKHYAGLPHRTQFVAEIDSVKFYNDSKSTNPGSCLAALQGMHRDDVSRTVVILGGECKQADFSVLTETLAQTCRAVILMGRDADSIRQYIPDALDTAFANNMQKAVSLAREKALPGDRVLLSPACASFDQFRNFEHRGAVFTMAVRGLLQ